MKKIFRTVAALAVVMFAGCTNDLTDDTVVSHGGKTTVTVGIEETKTYLGDLADDGVRKVYWSNDDQIAINGVASSSITINEEKTMANFTFESELNTPYSVLYPAADYVDATTINLPAVQAAATGTFATNCAPMAAYSNGSTIALKHLAAVVRLQVKLPAESTHATHTLTKVEIKGKANEQMSGDFTIDYASATLTATSTAEADKVVATKVAKKLNAESATDVFVVVPAQEYADGISVRLIDEAGHYMDIASKAMTLATGDIKAMPVVEFKPTGTIVGVEIASASDWNTFAAKYNAGEYAGVEPFVVNVIADIAFDEGTNANFASIAKFGGYLDGGNYTVKGLAATDPLFVETLAGSTIKNLTIDSTCSFTWDGDTKIAPFVGKLGGTLEGCTNNAVITVSTWNGESAVGGLVAENTATGVVAKCTNGGAITLSGENTANGNATLYIGGIVGDNNYGTISECTNTNNATVSSTVNAYGHRIGGIAGQVGAGVAYKNTNNAAVSCDGGANRIYEGGIVGYVGNNNAKVTYNTNNGSVSTAASVKFVYVGGVVGRLENHKGANDSFKHNSVSADVVVKNTGAPTSALGVGGLCGSIGNNSVIDLSGDTATIACTVTGGKNNGSIVGGVGGVVGHSNGDVSTVKNVTNWKGTVKIDHAIAGDVPVAFGGIWGYAPQGAKIENCTSNGKDTDTTISGTFQSVYSIGGILGRCDNGGLNISNCTNNARLYLGSSSRANFYPVHIAGIVGYCKEGDATITNCHNNASEIKNTGYNRVVENYNGENQFKANYTAGIIALYGAAERGALTTTGTITITGCTSKNDVWSNYGSVGGIAGYVRNATITSCTSESNVKSMSTTGGIVANALDSSISYCVAKCETLQSNTNGGNFGNTAGIVGIALGETTVDNCSFYGKVTTTNGRYGGIVGFLYDTSSVSNSRIGGTIQNTTISVDNYSTYVANNVNDQKAGENIVTNVTNCSYWDGVTDVPTAPAQ